MDSIEQILKLLAQALTEKAQREMFVRLVELGLNKGYNGTEFALNAVTKYMEQTKGISHA